MTDVIFDYVPSSDLPAALEIEQLGQRHRNSTSPDGND